jgi:hypothetical protein
MSTTLRKENVADRASSTAASADAGETIAAADLAQSGDSSAAPVTHAKICCVCGTNVANERRYKDAEGHYWCCECAKADSGRKHPIACPDCGQEFPSHELVELEGAKLCAGCRTKRQAIAKRAAARLAAAAEEERLQKLKYRRTLIAAGVAAGVLVVLAVARFVLH